MNAKAKKPAAKKPAAKKPAAKSAPKKPAQPVTKNGIVWHEIDDPDLATWDIGEDGVGEVGWGLPPEIMEMMVGGLLHVHTNKDEPSHTCFKMSKHPDNDRRVIIHPVNCLAGETCDTWLYDSDSRIFIGVSLYGPNELVKIAGAVAGMTGNYPADDYSLCDYEYAKRGEEGFRDVRMASVAIDVHLDWMKRDGIKVVRDNEKLPVYVDLRPLDTNPRGSDLPDEEVGLFGHLDWLHQAAGNVTFLIEDAPSKWNTRANWKQVFVAATAFAMTNGRFKVYQRDIDTAAKVLAHSIRTR